MKSKCILEIKELSKSFEDKLIFKNINYKFESNTLYAITGKSGSGKTTLLNILGLIDSKYEGEIIFNNEALKNSKDYYFLRSSKIGFIFQSYYLIDNLTVKENILLPLKYSHKNCDEKYFNSLVKKLEIEKIIDEKTNYLSGGEKQRVAIARALINNPSLIICDEPTGNLDEQNANKVMEIIKSLINDDRCVILVTHSNEIALSCDKILKLEGGNLHE